MAILRVKAAAGLQRADEHMQEGLSASQLATSYLASGRTTAGLWLAWRKRGGGNRCASQSEQRNENDRSPVKQS